MHIVFFLTSLQVLSDSRMWQTTDDNQQSEPCMIQKLNKKIFETIIELGCLFLELMRFCYLLSVFCLFSLCNKEIEVFKLLGCYFLSQTYLRSTEDLKPYNTFLGTKKLRSYSSTYYRRKKFLYLGFKLLLNLKYSFCKQFYEYFRFTSHVK